MKWSSASLLIAAIALSACSGDGKLTNFTDDKPGPDEFAVVPNRPLERPSAEMTVLPPPTPGAQNRADLTPLADAVVALGGRPAGGNVVPGSDAAMVSYAARRGVEPGVRQTLANEDAATRRRQGRRDLFRIGVNDDYTMAYKKQWLDADAERIRLEQAGVRTPSAPPPAD